MPNHTVADRFDAESENEAAGADRSHYLFPEADIAKMPSAKLLTLIENNIGAALDITDGSDLQSDLRIDFAQDLIEQARDTLMARGHVFDDAAQRKMSFLAWPLTPDQERAATELHDRERRKAGEYRAWASAARAQFDNLFHLVMAGCELPDGANFIGVKIDIGWSSCTNYYDGRTITRPNGAEVLNMKAALIECGCPEVKLAIFDSEEARAAFAAHPGPFWKIEFGVPQNPCAWELLRKWWHEHRIQDAPYVWYHEPIGRGQCKFTHWTIPNWPERADQESWVYGHIGHLEAPGALDMPAPGTDAKAGAGKAQEREIADRSHYLFPDSDIPTMSTVDLLALIERKMEDALDMTDGTDFNSDVRIDHSQDLIEQARDVLVDRGHVFGEQEQDRMHFLSWPVSPEKQAAEDAREEQERVEAAARYTVWREHEQKVKDLVRALAAGEPAPADFVREGLELSIGNSSANQHMCWPGHRVIELRDRIQEATGKEPFLGYLALEIGVPFKDQKAPAWKLCKIPVQANSKLWELVRETLVDHTSGAHGIEIWDHTPGPLDGFHCAIYDLFPIPATELDLTVHAPLESSEPVDKAATPIDAEEDDTTGKSSSWSWLDRALRCWSRRSG